MPKRGKFENKNKGLLDWEFSRKNEKNRKSGTMEFFPAGIVRMTDWKYLVIRAYENSGKPTRNLVGGFQKKERETARSFFRLSPS